MPPTRLRSHRTATMLLVGALLCGLALSASAAIGPTLVSQALSGEPALTGASAEGPSISGDGRYVAFTSDAQNFATPSPGFPQVFYRDLLSGAPQLVSRNAAGAPADQACYRPAVSATGRYVVFISSASNLATLPEGSLSAVYLRDMALGTLELIAPQDDPNKGDWSAVNELAISGDGRFVAFASFNSGLVPNDTNNAVDVFVKDRSTGAFERISVATGGAQANGPSGDVSIAMSDDGRYVSFSSYANNLVPGDTNLYHDVFVRNRQLQTTTRVSVASNGAQLDSFSLGGALSADGRYAAFRATGAGADPAFPFDNGIFVRDLVAGTTQLVSRNAGQAAIGNFGVSPGISRNGRWVVFDSDSPGLSVGDTNGAWDVFVWDRMQQSVQRVSAAAGSEPDGNSSLYGPLCVTDDGARVAFTSYARNLVPGDTNGKRDVFVRIRAAPGPIRVSTGPGAVQGTTGAISTSPVLSADGRVVAFWSDAFNLVPGDTNGAGDVFTYDRSTGLLERANVSSEGAQAELADADAFDWQARPALSADGRYVAFGSRASNLVAGDTNDVQDTFVHDRLTGSTERVSLSSQGAQGLLGTPVVLAGPAISSDGRFVAFITDTPNLVPGDQLQSPDLFVRDRTLGTTEQVSVAADGGQSNGFVDWGTPPSLSGDGRYVAFVSSSTDLVPFGSNPGMFVRDRLNGTTEALPETGGSPSLSRNGRYVVFQSADENIAFDDENGWPDTFVYDRVSRITDLVSITPTGQQFAGGAAWLPSISDDGEYVAFTGYAEAYSTATGYSLGIYRWNRTTGETLLVSPAEDGYPSLPCGLPTISGDGRSVVYIGFGPDPATGSLSFFGAGVLLSGLESPLLAAPEDPQIEALSATELRLTWVDASTGEAGFSIERWNGDRYLEVATTGPNAQQYVDGGLSPSAVYSYRIRACNKDGFSPYSPTFGTTTFRAAPAAPTDLTGAAESPTVVVLDWTDQSDTELGFKIWRSVDGGPLDLLAATSENDSSFRDESAYPNAHCLYAVQAYNEGGASTSVEVEVTTPPFPPTPPSSVIARAVGLASIRLDWNPGSSATSFRVERRTAATGFDGLATVQGITFTDTAAMANVTYTYRVIGINVAGESEPSEEVTATIPAQGKLSITPKKLNFGKVKVGEMKRLTLRLKNAGKVPLYGEVGAVNAPYRVVSGDGVFALSRGQTLNVVVEFAPMAAGLSNRSLGITSTTETAEERITITGRGK